MPIHAQADTRGASQTEVACVCLNPEPYTLNQNQNTHRRVSRQRLHVHAGGLRVCATRVSWRASAALQVALHRRLQWSRASPTDMFVGCCRIGKSRAGLSVGKMKLAEELYRKAMGSSPSSPPQGNGFKACHFSPVHQRRTGGVGSESAGSPITACIMYAFTLCVCV